MALSAHLGSLEAEKQKLRAQVSTHHRTLVLSSRSCPPATSSFPSRSPSAHSTPDVSASSGAPPVSGEPVAEGRAGQSSAEAAGQGAGSGGAGGAKQTPAVHVLYTQIRPGGAAAGESDECASACVRACVRGRWVCLQGLSVSLFKDIILKHESKLTLPLESLAVSIKLSANSKTGSSTAVAAVRLSE